MLPELQPALAQDSGTAVAMAALQAASFDGFHDLQQVAGAVQQQQSMQLLLVQRTPPLPGSLPGCSNAHSRSDRVPRKPGS